MGIQINGQTDTISAVDNNFSLAGNVSIGGTLTYEDVTSVDAVGLSTFKAGIQLDDSITHLGDTDTKIRFPANDTVTVETGGVERARVNSGGVLLGLITGVGVGGVPADLNSTEVGRGFINLSRDDTAAADHILFGKNGSIAASMGTDTTNTLVFKTGTTERLRIDSNGNVGINVTPPSFGSFKYFSVKGNSTSQGGIVHVVNSDDSVSGQFFSYNNLIWLQSSTNHPLVFGINGSNEKARIDSSGRVSINDNSRPASDANEGAQLRVTGAPLTRNQYYSPAGHYYGSFGYTDNTNTKSWIAVDSSYAKSSAVSAGIFLSAFHQDAGGSGCGFTIKNLRNGNPLVISSVVTAASVGNPAVETERLRITPGGQIQATGSGASGSVVSSKVTTNNGGYLAYEALNSSGNSVFSVTHNGRVKITDGIDFSSNANASGMTSELLDDYEEGTWTPTPYLSYNPSGRVVAGSGESGHYTRVGQLVTVWFQFNYSINGSGNFNLGINNLPFTARNNASFNYNGGTARENTYTGYMFFCENILNNTTQLQVIRRYDNGGPNNPSGNMSGSFQYEAA